MNKDELLMIPLIAKENSERHLVKIIILLVMLLIITNLVWSATWLIYIIFNCV